MEDPIRIGDKEYEFDKLPPKAQKMIQYMQTIDKQLTTLDTQMDMMKITREGCYNRLMTEVTNHAEESDTEKGRVQENPDAE